jgi:hypothetical protein
MIIFSIHDLKVMAIHEVKWNISPSIKRGLGDALSLSKWGASLLFL